MYNPIVVFMSMGVGVLLGIFAPNFSLRIQGIGEIYLIFITMTVLPILVSAIVSSVGNFVQNPVLYKFTFYALKIIIVMMIVVVVLTLLIGMIFKPGVLPAEQSKVLSEYIGKEANIFEFDLHGSDVPVKEDGFILQFLKLLIPVNILSAFITNNALGLAFISIIIGVAAGALASSTDHNNRSAHINPGTLIIDFFDNLFKVFQKVIAWTLTLIPLALISIISSQVAGFGFTIMFTTIRLVLLYYIIGITLMLFNSLFLGVVSGQGFINIVKSSFYPTLIGFSTKNSVATIPATIESLKLNLKYDAAFARLLVPLFIILCRYGNMIWFALVSVFATQIYGRNLGVAYLIILTVTVIAAGVSTAGANGFASLGVISIAFLPLGIPTETILFILVAIDPVIDPLRTAINVQTNFCTTAMVCSKHLKSNNDDDVLQGKFSHNNIEVVTER